MFFNTPNSSFIFDRRLRSMRLCAVFLAIFLPALVLPDFFLALVGVPGVDLGGSPSSINFKDRGLGFICMILRDLVGAGGSSA